VKKIEVTERFLGGGCFLIGSVISSERIKVIVRGDAKKPVGVLRLFEVLLDGGVCPTVQEWFARDILTEEAAKKAAKDWKVGDKVAIEFSRLEENRFDAVNGLLLRAKKVSRLE